MKHRGECSAGEKKNMSLPLLLSVGQIGSEQKKMPIMKDYMPRAQSARHR